MTAEEAVLVTAGDITGQVLRVDGGITRAG